jgi:hypothetical protein
MGPSANNFIMTQLVFYFIDDIHGARWVTVTTSNGASYSLSIQSQVMTVPLGPTLTFNGDQFNVLMSPCCGWQVFVAEVFIE